MRAIHMAWALCVLAPFVAGCDRGGGRGTNDPIDPKGIRAPASPVDAPPEEPPAEPPELTEPRVQVDRTPPMTRDKALAFVRAYRQAHIRRDAGSINSLTCSRNNRLDDRDGEHHTLFPDLRDGYSRTLVEAFAADGVLTQRTRRRRPGVVRRHVFSVRGRGGFLFDERPGELCFRGFDGLHDATDTRPLPAEPARTPKGDPLVGRWYALDPPRSGGRVPRGSPEGAGAIEFLPDGRVRFLTREMQRCRALGLHEDVARSHARARWARVEGHPEDVYALKCVLPQTGTRFNFVLGQSLPSSCECDGQQARAFVLRGDRLEEIKGIRDAPDRGNYPDAFEIDDSGAQFVRDAPDLHVTAEACAAWEMCRMEGWCSARPGEGGVTHCTAGSDADCAKSKACLDEGRCSFDLRGGGLCVPCAERDCTDPTRGAGARCARWDGICMPRSLAEEKERLR